MGTILSPRKKWFTRFPYSLQTSEKGEVSVLKSQTRSEVFAKQILALFFSDQRRPFLLHFRQSCNSDHLDHFAVILVIIFVVFVVFYIFYTLTRRSTVTNVTLPKFAIKR